jgi:DNA repair exonuclease SbcCD ATPase subunit
MPDTVPAPPLDLVEANSAHVKGDAADSAPDGPLDELSQQVAASEQLVADLERELAQAATQEAELAYELDTQRARRAALAEELRGAHEQALAVSVAEATRRGDAILSEAEAFGETARKDAEREATRITRQAFAEAKETLAGAEQKGAALLEARQQEVVAIEAEATRRVEELETEHEALTHRVEVAKTIYEELQNTLKLVAETSLAELGEAKASLARLDPDRPTTPQRPSNDQRRSPTAKPTD